MPHSRGHRHGSNRRVQDAVEIKDESKTTDTAATAPVTTPTTTPIGNAKARKAAKKRVKKSFKQVSSLRSVLEILIEPVYSLKTLSGFLSLRNSPRPRHDALQRLKILQGCAGHAIKSSGVI